MVTGGGGGERNDYRVREYMLDSPAKCYGSGLFIPPPGRWHSVMVTPRPALVFTDTSVPQ